jgi:hypothetical protein
MIDRTIGQIQADLDIINNQTDSIEKQYMMHIDIAAKKGDTDKAHELSIYLKQYREFYKA